MLTGAESTRTSRALSFPSCDAWPSHDRVPPLALLRRIARMTRHGYCRMSLLSAMVERDGESEG